MIVEAQIELLQWTYKPWAADARERPEECAGVRFFRGYRPPKHPVCTDNLSSSVEVVKPAKDGV